MKGNNELIIVLNSLLADELTVINQSIVPSERCATWGYSGHRLSKWVWRITWLVKLIGSKAVKNNHQVEEIENTAETC